MTVEERVRTNVRAAASGVPGRRPAPLNSIRRRGRRRTIRRRSRLAAVTALTGLGVVAVSVPFDPNPAQLAEAFGVPHVVEIADLEMAVEQAEPVFEDPNVWVGLPGPAPAFDTSALGPDLSLRPGQPGEDDLDERISEAVYLGDLAGEPIYIIGYQAPSIWDWFAEIRAANLSGEIIETPFHCCKGGDMDVPGGSPWLITTRRDNEEAVLGAEWLGLSPDVSVVAYKVGDTFIGWQTPVGGASIITLDPEPGEEVLFAAFDAEGNLLDLVKPDSMFTTG
jgi:hypothetical protein